MRQFKMLTALLAFASTVSMAADIHEIARIGSIFEMNMKLNEDGINLVTLDIRDEQGLTVWENALLNPHSAQMMELLIGYRDEHHQAFEEGYARLADEEVWPHQPTQFLLDEEIQADRNYNAIWGIGLGHQEANNQPLEDEQVQLPRSSLSGLSFSISPSSSS